ncbi:SDR family NAD(P)-dependent oxidoreductase [Nonlabens tegetincola]|uniref:SDR family NAD(P)-dependent oxidoreductase n=1 Tax=Nonlabens tegetincola TaxID=323273 RepID=UPI000CF5027B|nr:SDR family NAD(P)-dependent oxidoreductase [Nonlabens tegetincola]PQJ19206.1 short-chain dehydrogenase [Nonlabens tegetincola]
MKTILITGSTDGIGKLAAIDLAKNGHTIFIHGRNREKVSKVVEEITKLTTSKTIYGFTCNFSQLQSIDDFVNQIASKTIKLDVLINNAGVYNSPVATTNNGIDIRIAVNYLAPYLLTTKLLPLLEKSDSARVINLSSAAQSSISPEFFLGKETVSESGAYAQSKLALTMWSFQLAKEQPELNVIAVNPGSLLNTKMVKEAFGNHWSDASKGAGILTQLATSKRFNESSGSYFDNDKGDFSHAHDDAYNHEKLNQLHNLTQKLLKNKL